MIGQVIISTFKKSILDCDRCQSSCCIGSFLIPDTQSGLMESFSLSWIHTRFLRGILDPISISIYLIFLFSFHINISHWYIHDYCSAILTSPHLSGSCGAIMLHMLYQGTIDALTCLKKLRQIKLEWNTIIVLLITKLNFIKRRVWHHTQLLSFL